MPLMIFGKEEQGWVGIFRGIFSPLKNKYQVYIENILKKKEKHSHLSTKEQRTLENLKRLDTYISNENS